MKILLLLLFCHAASPAKHSLKYILTGTSGVTHFPELVAIGLVNEAEMGYCDSDGKMPEPKTQWAKKVLEDDPQHLEWYKSHCFGSQHIFRADIESFKLRFNQSGGVHILQRMSGCEWDDETGETKGFIQYGYDGEDFITLDLRTLTWVAPKPQAVVIKQSWDSDRHRNWFWKNSLIYDCPEFLRKYKGYRSYALQIREFPSVSLLQKSPSSPVGCHATGFYPDRAVIFWRKDEEEVHEDVKHGEILPNNDGTFQMSVDLNVSSVTPEDWGRYDCVFQLSGVKNAIVTKVNETVIRTNWAPVPPPASPAGPVIGAVVGLLLLAVCIAGLFIWRRKNNGFQLVTR